MSSRRAVSWIGSCLPLMLASCASLPPPEQGPSSPTSGAGIVLTPAVAPTFTVFEQTHKDRAEQLSRDGKWTEAAVEWEILVLLRPERVEYAKRWEEAKEKLQGMVASDLQSAADARRRGDVRGATTLYLTALSRDPSNTTAADALRDIERDQARRLHPGQLANGGKAAPGAGRGGSNTVSAADQRELEGAAMLLHQGDYAVSAQKLREYLRKHPQDELAKRTLRDAYARLGKQQLDQGKTDEALSSLEKAQQIKQSGGAAPSGAVQALGKDLAQVYYEQGVRIQRSDLKQAIALWEQALQHDPNHSQARLRLKQAKQMQRNLDAIENAKPK